MHTLALYYNKRLPLKKLNNKGFHFFHSHKKLICFLYFLSFSKLILKIQDKVFHLNFYLTFLSNIRIFSMNVSIL